MLLLAGMQNGPNAPRPAFFFKSVGNVGGGYAIVQALPVSELMKSTPPAASKVAHTYKSTTAKTAKKAASLPDGSCIVIFLDHVGADGASVIMRLSSTLTPVWGPKRFGNGLTAHGENTDVAISADKQSFVISGHGAYRFETPIGLEGRLSKFSITDGTRLW